MGHNGQYSFHTGSVKCKIIIFIDIYNYRPINSYINVALSSGPVLSGVRGINMAVKMLIVTFPPGLSLGPINQKRDGNTSFQRVFNFLI